MAKPLLPVRHSQKELFLADIADAVLKDDMASMEHPIFSLNLKQLGQTQTAKERILSTMAASLNHLRSKTQTTQRGSTATSNPSTVTTVVSTATNTPTTHHP